MIGAITGDIVGSIYGRVFLWAVTRRKDSVVNIVKIRPVTSFYVLYVTIL